MAEREGRALKLGHNIQSLRTRNREEYQKSNNESRFLHLFYKRTRVDFHDVKNYLITIEDVKTISKKIIKKSVDLENQLKLLINAFAMGEKHVDAFLAEDSALKALIGYLTGKNYKLQIYAVYCLTNITAFDNNRGHFVAKSASPYLITYLQSHNNLMQDLSACALGNIAAFSKQNKDLLVTQGVLKPLVELFKIDCPAVLESAAYALITICANEDTIIDDVFSFGIKPLLVKCMKNGSLDSMVIGELAWLLLILTSNELNAKEMIQESGMVAIAFKYLEKMSHAIKDNLYTITPFIRFMGNAFSTDETFEFLKTDLFFSTLKCYINCKICHVVKETCWMIGNFLTHGKSFAAMAVMCEVVPNLINHLNDDKNINAEVLVCLCNIASYDSEFADKIINSGIFLGMFKNFSDLSDIVLTQSLQLTEILLRLSTNGVETFREQNGKFYIETLMQNKNKTIEMISYDLKTKYLS